MKSFLRKLGIVALVLVAFFACSSISMYRQYTWLGKTTATAESNGWKLASVSDNYVNPVEPWTIIKQPPNMAVFVKPSEIRTMDDGLVAVPTLWMKNRALVDGEDNQSWHVADCRNRRLAIVDSTANSMSSLNWNSYEQGTPGNDLVAYVCAMPR